MKCFSFKKKKNISVLLALILFLAFVMCTTSGCGEKAPEQGANSYQVYYISADESSIVACPVQLELSEEATSGEIIMSLINLLQTSPNGALYHSVLDESCGFNAAVQNENQVIVDFDSNIMGVETVRGILIRAALVRTLTQVNGIDSVSCTVDGSAMLDSNGLAIGAMTADTFIDNAGAQINAEERAQLTLYFANEDGDRLVKVNRSVVYSGNISMDKLVVEQLLLGPQDGEKGSAVLNPDLKIINVTTQDGTCYVNLSAEFLSPPGTITNDVALYSIVDSLIELGTINRVQFLVDSDSDVMYRETVSLNTQFSRNLDLLQEDS